MAETKPTFLEKITQALKAYFTDPSAYQYRYPVSADVEDGVDNDGDGAEDYNAIVSAIGAVNYDLQQASSIGDENARSIAVKVALDGFLRELDEFRNDDANDASKAGARHSKSDTEHLDAIRKAHDEIGQHLDALDPQDEPEDEAEKAAKTEGKYGDVAYADEKNKKYPIDTEEHARAAWSYINKKKNAAEYSADELATVRSKIKAACKKFGIEINDDASKGDSLMTPAEKAAVVAEVEAGLDAKVEVAVKAAVEPLNAKIAEQDTALETANKAVEEAKAAAEKAIKDAEAVKADADKRVTDAEAAKKAAEDALADAVTKARSRKAAGGHENGTAQDSRATLKEQLKENPSLKIADAVKTLMSGTPVTVPPQ